jgi:hypothetical protein
MSYSKASSADAFFYNISYRIIEPYDGGPQPIRAYDGMFRSQWVFDPDDPYAFSMSVASRQGIVDWPIGRDLLNEGLQLGCGESVGEGDVRFIRPEDEYYAHHWLDMVLISPDEQNNFQEIRADLLLDSTALRQLMGQSLSVVPPRYEEAMLAQYVDQFVVECLNGEQAE